MENNDGEFFWEIGIQTAMLFKSLAKAAVLIEGSVLPSALPISRSASPYDGLMSYHSKVSPKQSTDYHHNK